MIIICVVSIVFWELLYDFGAVKLTAGQNFRYYYDFNIHPSGNAALRREIADKKTLSYDVLKISSEAISADYNVLTTRLSIQEGDIIFTDAVGIDDYNVAIAKGETPKEKIRAYTIIDTIDYRIASIDVMLENAKKYLKDNFFVDGYSEQNGYGAENIDQAKVRSVFLKRNGKDNRFRTASAINQGVKLENDRIVKLCENVEFMLSFINNPDNSDAIMRYTKFAQSYEFSKSSSPNIFKDRMEIEKQYNRDNDVYGINLGKLTGGKSITAFMQYKFGGDITDIVVMAFEFTSYQPHLQYESLSWICSTIKICTGAV